MIVTLKSYLESLEERERVKPEEERRKVPNLVELAEVAGVHKATLSRFAGGQTRSLPFDMGVAILDELNRRGFKTNVNDILTYLPPEDTNL